MDQWEKLGLPRWNLDVFWGVIFSWTVVSSEEEGYILSWTAFCLRLLFALEDCILPQKNCILSSKILRFALKALLQAVAATDDSPAIPEHTTVETPMNISLENKAHFQAKKEAIHLILTGIGDEIYSTVDVCQTAQEMWEAIERLQQGKEIAKPITPPSETASEEDIDPEQAQRDKDMQKNLSLIAKNAESQKGLKTRRITRKRCCCANKLSKVFHFMLSNMTGKQTRMKKLMNRNWKHITAIWQRFRRFLQLNQAPIQSHQNSNTCLVETDDSIVIPDSPDMCEDDIQNDQNDVESDDEHIALANLIANLKLIVDENIKI
nr:hypothetical protein [Tanacetum cinerariifolium]